MRPNGNCGESDIAGLTPVDVTLADDMEAFDMLGPKVREVLNFDMGVRFSASETLKFITGQGVDPKNPKVDAHMASCLRTQNEKILRRLAVIEET
jgi:hypothetical protein